MSWQRFAKRAGRDGAAGRVTAATHIVGGRPLGVIHFDGDVAARLGLEPGAGIAVLAGMGGDLGRVRLVPAEGGYRLIRDGSTARHLRLNFRRLPPLWSRQGCARQAVEFVERGEGIEMILPDAWTERWLRPGAGFENDARACVRVRPGAALAVHRVTP